MKEVVIIDAVRTPLGNHGGMLRDFDATTLAQIAMRAVLERTKIDPAYHSAELDAIYHWSTSLDLLLH